LAHFNLYRSKGGYGFEVTYDEGRFSGWRPTRGWAKRAAQTKLLEAMDIDAGVTATFVPADHERLFSQGARRRRRFEPMRNGGIWIVAVVVVVALIAASAFYLVRRSSKTPEFSGPLTMSVYATNRLQPVMGFILNDFKLLHPEIIVNVVYGTNKDFESRAQKLDLADIYIDAPSNFGWITNYVVPDGTESQLGYDVLEMIVKAGNPQHIADMNSIINNSSLKLGVCNFFQPCGFAATNILKNAQVKVNPAQPEAKDAKANIDQVASGAVDTAFVFRTDYSMHPIPGLTPIPLDDPYDARQDYEVRKGRQTVTGAEFLDFLHSTSGSATLHRIGLLAA
jgi:ABC-type molybdate transport system substrate-binding protein